MRVCVCVSESTYTRTAANNYDGTPTNCVLSVVPQTAQLYNGYLLPGVFCRVVLCCVCVLWLLLWLSWVVCFVLLCVGMAALVGHRQHIHTRAHEQPLARTHATPAYSHAAYLSLSLSLSLSLFTHILAASSCALTSADVGYQLERTDGTRFRIVGFPNSSNVRGELCVVL